jgi:hypothetical protein
MSSITTLLTGVERSKLADLESVVDRGLKTFVEVGHALMEIRDSRLYRATHRTFRAYCEERFGFSDSRGRQLIAAAKTVTDVTLLGLPAPTSEGGARRLAREIRREADRVRAEAMTGEEKLAEDSRRAEAQFVEVRLALKETRRVIKACTDPGELNEVVGALTAVNNELVFYYAECLEHLAELVA